MCAGSVCFQRICRSFKGKTGGRKNEVRTGRSSQRRMIMNDRIEKVLANMKKEGISQLIVSDPSSLWYLSGIGFDPYERLLALLIRDNARPVFFLNNLFNVHGTPFEEVWFSDTDDYIGMMAKYIRPGRLGIDKTWAARFLIPLMERCPYAKPVIGSGCVDDCRAVKDESEIAKMIEASRINDIVNERASRFVSEGMTERQVADFIEKAFVEEGAEGPSFTTIVSFGKNAADPHHEPDDTVLKRGECVLYDMGCIKDHYCSDMTRTFLCGNPDDPSDADKIDPDFVKVYNLVREANEKAESMIRPGVRFCDIDAAARDLITSAGYGPQFNHRLGHFIGQSEHEQGDVSAVNTSTAKPGMIFSIEPGVYIEGRFGVRIEDLVLVTETGHRVLNHVDKNLKVVGTR